LKCFLVIIALTLLFSVPGHAEDLIIDLRYAPTANTAPSPALLATVKQLRPVRIGAFTDKRAVADNLVGELKINGQPTRVLSKAALADYVADSFLKVYGEFGGKSSPEGLLHLKGEVTQFRMEEADGYQARVGFHFYLLDENSKVLWDGHTSGIVRGSGRVLTPESLSVIISDILRTTFAEMMEDGKLVGVWSGTVSNTYAIGDNPAATAVPVSGGR